MLGAEAGGWTLLWGQVSSFRDGRLTKPAMSSVLGHARLPQCPRQQPESWTQRSHHSKAGGTAWQPLPSLALSPEEV